MLEQGPSRLLKWSVAVNTECKMKSDNLSISMCGLVICGVPELGRVLALPAFGNCSVGPRIAAVGDHAGAVHRDVRLRTKR